MGNPYRHIPDETLAFEAKDFLRKMVIGKDVRVEVEFTKQIPMVDFDDETKTIHREMVFATVFIDDRMVQLEMVKAGYATANEVRGDLS